MQARRAARELALILFSQMDTIENLNKWDFQDIVLKSVRTLTNNSADELKAASAAIMEMKEYIVKIANSYKENQEDVDAQIKKFAFGWDINRLVRMDKDILRIAIAEIAFIKDAPHKVAIDEALELAKKYSTDDSPSFINGILARVVEKYV